MPAATRDSTIADDNPLWYKDAVIYELHVRAFFDSSGDGMGDFSGLTQKLDYLQDLGVTALWLLPFYPSPWKDDGYDIADYTSIHESYGHMRDFRRFLREAHARGLRVINELVINHTSDQHPWFQRARKAKPGSAARDFYVWADSPDQYSGTRIIFKDFESSNWAWDPVARAYYWHRFYSHQPDLNFDNPAVHRAIFRVMDHWFKMGVDGMRLDAIPYLYEREGTSCENLPETHQFLKKLRAHLDQSFQDRMFLAEANQWPEETVPYFGDGDECHMGFHFPVMPRLFMAIQMEDRFPIVDILEQTPQIPETCQWATFLRNHDELTLEMVTDEERDYMYRMYASDPQARINLGIRRRLAPLLHNNRRKIELMNALLFSLGGTPVLYYGDEIGMGDNIYLGDRNGVRTPMQWSGDRNAGFSRANPQRLYLPVIVDPEYHYETVNVEAQQSNPSSLLWWTKRMIALRKGFKAFSRGSIDFIYPDNRKVLAFVRRHEDEQVLVIANLSRFVQYARLDLSAFRDRVPIELFGRTEFPRIEQHPYFLTLGPHAFYWFQLSRSHDDATPRLDGARTAAPTIPFDGAVEALISGAERGLLEDILPDLLPGKRWFQGKARVIRDVTIRDVVPVRHNGHYAGLALVSVAYVEEATETYVMPLGSAEGERAHELTRDQHSAIIAHLDADSGARVLHDALVDPGFRSALLGITARRRRVRGEVGELFGWARGMLRKTPAQLQALPSRLVAAEQSNSSMIFGDRVVIKLYRRLEDGVSLDVEMGRFLTEHGFTHTPAVVGTLDYRSQSGVDHTLAVVQEYVPNEGDAWDLTRDQVQRFFERVAAADKPPPPAGAAVAALLRAATRDEPSVEFIGPYLEEVRLLGKRTAEMHRVLASEPADPAFAPEPFTRFYQRSLYQSMRTQAEGVLHALRRTLDHLPEHDRDAAQRLLELEPRLQARFRAVIEEALVGARMRCHGDYHLGQVLFTGNDFCITDFEGEPLRALSERKLKRSPMRDVAGMLRSFHYAVHAPITKAVRGGLVASIDPDTAQRWASFWYARVAATFLRGYLGGAGHGSVFLPPRDDELAILLDVFLLDKAVYELSYELNNRPNWAGIPMAGLFELLREPT